MLLSLLLAFQAPAPIPIDHLLAITPVAAGGRVPFQTDPVQYQLVEGTWTAPQAGDVVKLPDGKTATWKDKAADKDAWFSGPEFEGGYAYAEYDSEEDQNILLHAIGDSMCYVNGDPIPGDPYQYGYVYLPVHLHKGKNSLLFLSGAGKLKVELVKPHADVQLNPADTTLPDSVVGEQTHNKFGAIPVINSTERPVKGLILRTWFAGNAVDEITVPEIQGLSTLKVPISIPKETWPSPQTAKLHVELVNAGNVLDRVDLDYRVRTPDQTRKETYVSDVDGSVQYYAVVPPTNPKPGLAMMLSLHGASVEATSQADAYSPKDWAYVVCPTNRRPYGFDWEDWGRQDGIDVLKIAEKEYRTDPNHTYVTGHSMGGHGTWQFGVLFPENWAAIGVSAGWSSFYSYVGVPWSDQPSAMQAIFQRAAGTSNTHDLTGNLLNEGVYILHGEKDDNVPVAEAQEMYKLLSGVPHQEVIFHEQPEVGHWWSTPLTKGASCLEWPDMMDFLRGHSISAEMAKTEDRTADLVHTVENDRVKYRPQQINREPGELTFTAVDLKVSNSYHGIQILRQIHPLEPSTITTFPNALDEITVRTQNVAAFSLPETVTLQKHILVDGQSCGPDAYSTYDLVHGRWMPSPEAIPVSQIGPFKHAFANHVVLVYGTAGTPAENEWAQAKARYDSEAFWYRGNGSLRVYSDKEFLAAPNLHENVVLYGNADTNLAWKSLLADSPIQVHEGAVKVDLNPHYGNDLSAIFCWHKNPGDPVIGGVGGTGIKGMLLTNRMPYFTSGIGFPDWTIDTPESLRKGMQGVFGAGFFDDHDGVSGTNSAWQ